MIRKAVVSMLGAVAALTAVGQVFVIVFGLRLLAVLTGVLFARSDRPMERPALAWSIRRYQVMVVQPCGLWCWARHRPGH